MCVQARRWGGGTWEEVGAGGPGRDDFKGWGSDPVEERESSRWRRGGTRGTEESRPRQAAGEGTSSGEKGQVRRACPGPDSTEGVPAEQGAGRGGDTPCAPLATAGSEDLEAGATREQGRGHSCGAQAEVPAARPARNLEESLASCDYAPIFMRDSQAQEGEVTGPRGPDRANVRCFSLEGAPRRSFSLLNAEHVKPIMQILKSTHFQFDK